MRVQRGVRVRGLIRHVRASESGVRQLVAVFYLSHSVKKAIEEERRQVAALQIGTPLDTSLMPTSELESTAFRLPGFIAGTEGM